MEKVTHYKSYTIEAAVRPVDARSDPPHAGKWTADQYLIGKDTGEAITRKKVVHETSYCDTEEEAIRLLWMLAVEAIDRGVA